MPLADVGLNVKGLSKKKTALTAQYGSKRSCAAARPLKQNHITDRAAFGRHLPGGWRHTSAGVESVWFAFRQTELSGQRRKEKKSHVDVRRIHEGIVNDYWRYICGKSGSI